MSDRSAGFVLDASVVLTWCFPDESSQKAELISERISSGESPVVTPFWPHEVLNALLVGERRKRLTPDLTRSFLSELKRMKVEIDSTMTLQALDDVELLCRRHGLTSYDAAYLELAKRQNRNLATVDELLMKAALEEGVVLL